MPAASCEDCGRAADPPHADAPPHCPTLCDDCYRQREAEAWQEQEQMLERDREERRARERYRERMEGEYRDTVLGERYRAARASERY